MNGRRWSRFLAWSVPVVVALVLARAGIEAGDPDECLDWAQVVPAGETAQLTVDAPTWLVLGTEIYHAYRVDVAGGQGSSLELWTSYWESGGCTVYSSELVGQWQGSGATESVEWAAEYSPRALWVSPPEGGSASLEVALAELAAPPTGDPLVVPAVAHRPGVGDALFATDLWLLSREAQPVDVALTFVPEAAGEGRRVDLSLAPQQLLHLEDLVLETFGLDGARGALLASPYGPLVVLSQTSTAAPSGSYGEGVPAERWHRAAGVNVWEGPVRTLLHVAGDADYRTNVGLVEVLGVDSEVDLELVDGDGSVVATGTVTVPAGSFLQLDDVFSRLGAPPLAHGSMTVTLRGLGRVFSYASVVDNRSSDPLFLPGLPATDACASLVVPAVAAVAGAHGTHWQSDLWLQRRSAVEQVRLTFLPADGSAATSASFPIATDGTLVLDDVVTRLGRGGSGALLVEAGGEVLAASRTYNVTPAGTYGQLIPAQCWPYYSELRSGTIVGVEGSAARRTNVGMVNPGHAVTFDVALRLVAGDGVLLGSRTYQLPPGRHLQVNDVFAALHVPGRTDCRVDLEVAGGESWEGIQAYGSVVDNASGDPLYVPAVESWRSLEVEVELDNRRNAVLLDRLPEAVGVELLPAGTLTATVSGSGDLGRPELPIRVLCLYHDPAGRLRSAVLAVGESVSDVAGGGRLWCVIPDWLDTADNTGAVAVSLTGGAEPVTLDLDARANAVAFDRLEGPVVWARPGLESLAVATTGDLGRPELAPQVLAMYREEGSRRLAVRSLVDGEAFGPVATDFQLLVAVVDWLSRDDNTGTTRLERACTTRAGACGRTVSGSLGPSDCEVAGNRVGERVTLAGEAGQVLSLVARTTSRSLYLAVDDPSGRQIAASEVAGGDGQAELEGLTLPLSGTYEVWVVKGLVWVATDDYALAIACQGP